MQVYATDSVLGSPAQVWENLTAIAKIKPVKDNTQGSYMTMQSKNGFIFGIISESRS